MRQRRMRWGAVLLALVLLLAILPTTAMAIDTTMTGEEFLALAEDGVLELTEDVTLSSTAVISSNLVIQLNNHTLTREKCTDYVLSISAGTVTIQGPGTVSGGSFETISSGTSPKDVLNVSGAANLTIENAKLSGGEVKDFQRNTSYDTLVTTSHSGTLTLDHATVTGVNVANLENSNRDGGTAVDLGGSSSATIIDSTLAGGVSQRGNGGDGLYVRANCSATIMDSTLIGGESKASRDGGDGLYISSNGSVNVSGGSITGGQGNSGGKGVNVAGSVKLEDVTVTGGASFNSTPGVGLYCTSPAKSVEVIEAQIIGGSVAEGKTGNSAGRAVEIYGPVVLKVQNSTIQGGNNNRTSGSPIGGNAIWFYNDNAVGAQITLIDTTLGVGNEPANGAVITGNANAPAGSGGLIAQITASGTLTVNGGTMKNTNITVGESALKIEAENGAVTEVGENDFTVTASATVEQNGQTTYYPTASDAIQDAKSGGVVVITSVAENEELPAPAAGVTVENKTGETIVIGGETVAADESVIKYAAQIGGTKYKTLSAAVAAAKPGDTVELLNDVTEATWSQIWNITGITLEGNGHTLTVEQIVSGQNHDALFHSAGGNTFQNLTIDLTQLEAPAVAAQGTRAFSAAAGDAFYDVKILGCENLSYGITVSGTEAGQEETITIDGCRFEDCGYGIYSDEVTNLEKLVIRGCVFDGCDYATILYTEETEFTGNTVYGGKLNILHEQQIVTDNIFDEGSRIKFYEDPAQFVRNQISSDSRLDAAAGVQGIHVAENYWGGGAPSEEQRGGVDVVGADIYYQSPDMDDGDLNTDRAVTLVYNNGEKNRTVYVTAGEEYTLPSKPNKKGYTFLGWKSSADRKVYKAGATVKIDEDTTFTAQWMSNWEIVDDIAGAAGAGQEFFTDVKAGDWYYDAVKFVFDNNFMDGVGDGKFNPDGTLTRAMIAQVLYNLEGETGSYPTVFDDVAKSAWYADAVNWAAASGIVEGKGNNKFDPNAAITRQEMAAILYRYSDLKGYDVSDVDSLAAFTDANKVADWAKEAMGWAVENYVINGKGAGKLDPTGTATRAEVAQILMNLCNNVL